MTVLTVTDHQQPAAAAKQPECIELAIMGQESESDWLIAYHFFRRTRSLLIFIISILSSGGDTQSASTCGCQTAMIMII